MMPVLFCEIAEWKGYLEANPLMRDQLPKVRCLKPAMAPVIAVNVMGQRDSHPENKRFLSLYKDRRKTTLHKGNEFK